MKGPRRGYVVLPVVLKGKLSLDEWRPIITSSILHVFAPEFKRVWRTTILVWRIALVSAIVFLATFLILQQLLVALIDTAFLFAILFAMTKFINYHVIRGSRLRADRKTEEIMGRDQLSRTLVKIDNMHILDLEELKRSKRTMWQRRESSWPTMNERLDNLKTAAQP